MSRHFFTVLLVCIAFPSTFTTAATSNHSEFVAPKTVPIYFKTLDGKTFPYPLVHVVVAGKPSTMILDTGSTDVVLSRSITTRLGLAVSARAGSGADAAGKSVSVVELAAPDILIEGWGRLTRTRVLTTPLPKAFDMLGIAGVLSPQRLAGSGESVVVNLRSDQMSVVSDSKAATYFRRLPALKPMPIVFQNKSNALQYGATAQVNGAKVPLMFDTGASSTSIDIGSTLGQKLIQESASNAQVTYAASGKMKTRLLRDAHLRVGRITETLDIQLVPSADKKRGAFDGVLGMDFLRQCVLVLGSRKAAAACE